jgi:SAM-dependent methyltransferase
LADFVPYYQRFFGQALRRNGTSMSRPKSKVDTSAVKHKRAFISISTSGVRDTAVRFVRAGKVKVLDVGCGNALFFAQALLDGDPGLFCLGLDYSMGNLLEAKEVFRTNQLAAPRIVRGDAFRLPFRAGTFDQVFCLNVFINRREFGEVEAIIDEMVRVCAPGGSIVFDIRNAQNPVMRLKCWLHNRKGGFQTNAYRLRQVCEVLRSRGLEVARREPVGPPGRWFALAYVIEARVPPGLRLRPSFPECAGESPR